MTSTPSLCVQHTTALGLKMRLLCHGIRGRGSLKGAMEQNGNSSSKPSSALKYCFKCGRAFPEEMMRPKVDVRGRRIGAQCIYCHARQSASMINGKPSQ